MVHIVGERPLRELKTLCSYFCEFIENEKINCNDFAKKLARNCEKIILGTSDAWLMSHLSQWPSDPAYYIEHWRIQYYCFHLMAKIKSFDNFLGMQKPFCYKEMIPNQKTKYGNVFLCIFAFRIWAFFAFFFQMDDALGTFLHFPDWAL